MSFLIKISILDISSFDDNEIDGFVEALPFGSAEKDRLSGIKNYRRYKSSAAALMGLSLIVEEDTPMSIERTSLGKPFFPHAPHLKFSLSHSDDLAISVLDDSGNDIGVDVEFIRENFDTRKIATRFFGNTDMSDDDFFALWTKKEAYSKMLGAPLAPNLKETPDENIFKQFKITFNGKEGYICICSKELEKQKDVSMLHRPDKMLIEEI